MQQYKQTEDDQKQPKRVEEEEKYWVLASSDNEEGDNDAVSSKLCGDRYKNDDERYGKSSTSSSPRMFKTIR
jgi:hypothetical protein